MGVARDSNPRALFQTRVSGLGDVKPGFRGRGCSNSKGIPQELKRLAYIAFVRSGMEYASIIWDPHFIKDSDALERVQRRAARWITNNHDRTTSVTSLLQQLHLEPLEERRRISRLTFLYKVLNEHVAVPMNHLDLVLCDRHVRGPTTKQKLKIPRCASTRLQKSFAARSVTEWNSLPHQIPSPRWLQYHPSEASCLLYHASRRAHSIATISTGVWQSSSRSRSRSRTPRDDQLFRKLCANTGHALVCTTLPSTTAQYGITALQSPSYIITQHTTTEVIIVILHNSHSAV